MIINQATRGGSEESRSGQERQERGRSSRAVRLLVRHRSRLQRRERLTAIGEMASTLVHEIRNPLAVIGGYAREMLNTEPAAEEREPLNIIAGEVSKLESLIDNVLGFARTERSQLRSQDINSFLRETCRRMEALCRQADIEVQLELVDDLPGLLFDRTQVGQVLDNLCANARQVMPHGGTVTVSTCRVGDEVEVRIGDTGPGVPASLKGKIFEPFYSTSSTGTGLGLAVATKIMAGHGGSIRLDSRAKRGAVFTLRFPIPKVTQEA